MIEPRKNFTIRLSDEEREQAEYDAKANNMKLSDYVRYLITHGGRVDQDRYELFDRIYQERKREKKRVNSRTLR